MIRRMLKSGLAVLSGLVVLSGVAFAQESPAPNRPVAEVTSETASPTGTRRALIICGLAGDADHRKLFGESLEMLYTGLVTYHGFGTQNIHVLWGEKPTEKDPGSVRASRDIATRETIAAAAEAVRNDLQAEDTLWVFVLGHAHFDGRLSWLNLAGDDLNHVEFGRLFADVTCREQVFFVTIPCSGYYIKPLAQPGRIVISATEADIEVNETIFPHRLARAIGTPPAIADFDMDLDGQFTVFDLYVWIVRDIALEYATGELLATEHALLDDSGDGRGTEIQADYLSEELGGRRRASTTRPPLPKGDGMRSRQVPLALPESVTRPTSPLPPPLPIDF